MLENIQNKTQKAEVLSETESEHSEFTTVHLPKQESLKQPENEEAQFKPLKELLDDDFIEHITQDFRVQPNWKVKIVMGADFDPQDVSYKG